MYANFGKFKFFSEKTATVKNCNTNAILQTAILQHRFFQICFPTKYNFFYKESKSKKNSCFFYFFSFNSHFSTFFFCLLLCQTILRWLVSFLRFFFVFKYRIVHYLKKTQTAHNEKFFKLRSEFFLINVSRIMWWFFLVVILN